MALQGVDVRGPVEGRHGKIVTPGALAFLAELHRRFDGRRRDLLGMRRERQGHLDRGARPDFPAETAGVREGDWQVAPVPHDLRDRRVEITGPTDRKMMINALNSGAKVFMADFEDSNAPFWHNILDGHVNLIDAIERTIAFTSPEGREYRLNDQVATLVVRPRGWHLDEKHLVVEGRPISGSLVDAGLYVWHNARRLLDAGSGPYLYLPKLENHLEARLWNDALSFAEERLGLDPGTIKATVLIETVLGAFEMEEILYELRERSAGLNAGRWDYIFSFIKKFRHDPAFVLPDRNQVTMTVPFMRAYTELLVRTCHRRGAHAIGGMAAFIPSRKDPEINERAIAKVREDKDREASDGFDGTWVAHPDLVPVAGQAFDDVLGDAPNQLGRRRDDVDVGAGDLLDVRVPGGEITEAGLRNNVNVGIQYLSSWLRGNGAAAIFNLMEDTATAEIARAQVWQWRRHAVTLSEGRRVDLQLVRRIVEEEVEAIRAAVGDEAFRAARPKEAQALFEEVALSEDFVEFLTLAGSSYID